jgi:7-cyano-7-deazaguanine synthase
MPAQPKAVVLLSGGMDSCVTAAIARTTHERRAFDEMADYWQVPAAQRLVVRLDHLAQIGGSALTDHRIAVPEDGHALISPASGGLRGAAPSRADAPLQGNRTAAIPVTYVPFRNAHLLSMAVSWAEVLGATALFIGAVAEDSSGYPDCRPEYYRAFQEVVRIGTKPESRIEIHTPVIAMNKSEIVERGIALGAPLHLTWSCYQFDDEACGGCESCVLRLQAFAGAGVRDPIAYRARVGR